MTELFLELVNRSVEASWLVLAVLVLRLVLLLDLQVVLPLVDLQVDFQVL